MAKIKLKGPGGLSKSNDSGAIAKPFGSGTIGDIIDKYSSKKVCNMMGLFDATASMDLLWNNTKRNLTEILDRLDKLDGQYQFQWVAYRDYSEDNRITEQSGWSTDKSFLMQFVDRIVCFGGGDYREAVEVALDKAAEDSIVTDVLLIADAPPHEKPDHRLLRGMDWRDQAIRLAKAGRKVNCFVVGDDERTHKAFSEIADITNGVCGWLQDMESLIDVIAMSAAFSAGGKSNLLAYEEKYKLSHEGKDLKDKLLMLEQK